jgi:uncharacterized protein involved in type VI secretion and phage assembly
MPAASSSVITFEVPPMDQEAFLVRTFSGQEGLSQSYQFKVSTLVEDAMVDRDNLLGKQAHFGSRSGSQSCLDEIPLCRRQAPQASGSG